MDERFSFPVISLNGQKIQWQTTSQVAGANPSAYGSLPKLEDTVDEAELHGYRGEGWHVLEMDVITNGPAELAMMFRQGEIQIVFMLKGASWLTGFQLPQNCYRFLSGCDTAALKLDRKGAYRLISLHFLPRSLEPLAGSYDVLRKFLNPQISGGPVSLTPYAVPLSAWGKMQLTELFEDLSSGIWPEDVTALQIENLVVGMLDEITRDLIVHRNDVREYDEIRVYELTEYILLNLSEPFTARGLATRVGISASRLKLAFQRIYGCNLFAFIEKIRLEKAKFLLAETEMSIENIAFETGFSSQSYFSVVFKKQFGLSPSAFQLTI